MVLSFVQEESDDSSKIFARYLRVHLILISRGHVQPIQTLSGVSDKTRLYWNMMDTISNAGNGQIAVSNIIDFFVCLICEEGGKKAKTSKKKVHGYSDPSKDVPFQERHNARFMYVRVTIMKSPPKRQ